MTTLFQLAAAASLLLAANSAHATPVQATRYDDTAYPDVEIAQAAGMTAGGPGIAHDDVTYPEKLQSGGEAAFAVAAGTRYDDVSYPTPAPSPAARIAASPAPEATAHAALAVGMNE